MRTVQDDFNEMDKKVVEAFDRMRDGWKHQTPIDPADVELVRQETARQKALGNDGTAKVLWMYTDRAVRHE